MPKLPEEIHDVVWTPSKIARFWNQYARVSGNDESYFSKSVGGSLIRFVHSEGVALGGRVLDFGCGPGYLLDFLSRHGGACQGVDFSETSVEVANRRLDDKRGFAGALSIKDLPTPFSDGQFDVVFLVETLEHLLPEYRDATLKELRRLLTLGGKLVVTTPNEEDLAQRKVACPDCGCVFHRMQHVTSWSARSLELLLSQYGFQTVRCKAVRLAPEGILGAGINFARILTNRTQPHLVYIGQKVKEN